MSIFKKRKNKWTRDLVVIHERESDSEDNSNVNIATGYAATGSAQFSAQQAAQKYSKPDSYTGNRTIYDDGAAKRKVKADLFKDGTPVFDPYTGNELKLTIKEAKATYGENWQSHLAESDHVKPLERIYNDTKNNVWNTTDDINTAANSSDNLKVSSRSFNNPKRSRTNKEYVENETYLESKGVKLTAEGKQAAIRDGEIAEKSINRQLRKAAAKNVLKTGHEAGMQGAANAGITTATMSGIMNLVAVIKGEKDSSEAIADIVVDTGKAAVTGYAMSGELTVISQSLSGSSSKFLQALSKSNVPGKVITAVIVTGDTLKRYGNGEITTEQCLVELGEKGLNFATMAYSMSIGQALIPIPVVGGAIGALVGSVLTSNYYNKLINTLKSRELEHQERQRIIAECNKAAEQCRAFRAELESYLDAYFKDYQDCFDEALSTMSFAYQIGDADGVIAGANQITRKLGGQVHYETVEQFKNFLDNTSIDVL